MNFFGHAVAARLVDDAPAFVLGAMAPDLLPLCGAVAGAETSPEVGAGEAHHRSVDAIFHASPAFGALQAWATGELRQRGLPRGAARGAAHIGIELFLDGALARDTSARDGYLRCLRDAETTRAPFVWEDDVSRQRWWSLVLRLRTGTIPDAYRDPDFVGARIIGALARRPRLALPDADAATLHAFLPALAARVTSEAPSLVDAVITG